MFKKIIIAILLFVYAPAYAQNIWQQTNPWLIGKAQLATSILAQEGTNTPHQNGEMPSPPTITVSPTQPSGLTNCPSWTSSPQSYGYWGGQVYTYASIFRQFPVATVSPTTGNVTDSLSATAWRVETNVTSAKFAWHLLAGSSLNYRFIIDGFYASLAGTNVPGGGDQYVVLDFAAVGGNATRNVILEGQQGRAIIGVCGSAGNVIAYPSNHPTIKTSLLSLIPGDSVTAGTGPATSNDGPVPQLCDLLGASNCWASGVGGSGYVNTNSGAVPNFGQRLFDVTAYCQFLVINAFGVNDINNPGVQAAATSDIAAERSSCPNAIIFTIGPYDINAPSPPVSGFDATNSAISAACATVSGCFFINLKGVTYAQNGPPHPTAAGATTLANFMYSSIKTAIGVP